MRGQSRRALRTGGKGYGRPPAGWDDTHACHIATQAPKCVLFCCWTGSRDPLPAASGCGQEQACAMLCKSMRPAKVLPTLLITSYQGCRSCTNPAGQNAVCHRSPLAPALAGGWPCHGEAQTSSGRDALAVSRGAHGHGLTQEPSPERWMNRALAVHYLSPAAPCLLSQS